MRGAEPPRPLELAVVDVDGHDRRRPGDPGPGDGGVADPAAADDRDAVAPADAAGVDGGAEAGHDAAPQQTGGGGRRRRVDLRALPGGDQRLLGEGTDAQRGAERGAVGQRHLLRGVVRREAVPGPAATAGPALAAHGTPVQDDEVARRDVGDTVADRLDHTGRLVPQEERELVVDAAVAVVQVGVAHPAGLHPDERLARPGVGHQDGLERHGGTLRPGDHPLHLVRHGQPSRSA